MESRTYYNPSNGKIIRSMRADVETLELNAPPNCNYIDGIWDGQEYRIVDNQPVSLPIRSSDCFTFDYDVGIWIDPRSESDWSAELYARREVASMPRAEFVIRCVDFGVFDKAEGMQAASGTITPTMQTIIDNLPTEEQFEASVIWAASSTIFRTNTLIINMAAAIFIDEWTLDEVFGVEWPEPLSSWPAGKLHP